MVPEISPATDIFFCHLGPFFLPFNPLNSPKNENIKKMKTPGLEILSIYTSVPKLMIIGYTVLEIWCMMDVIVVFHFGQFFALSPP